MYGGRPTFAPCCQHYRNEQCMHEHAWADIKRNMQTLTVQYTYRGAEGQRRVKQLRNVMINLDWTGPESPSDSGVGQDFFSGTNFKKDSLHSLSILLKLPLTNPFRWRIIFVLQGSVINTQTRDLWLAVYRTSYYSSQSTDIWHAFYLKTNIA